MLKAGVGTMTGYGNDTIGIAVALERMGHDVHFAPNTRVSPPVPPEVARLLTKWTTPPFDLLINHAPPDQLGLTRGERAVSALALAWSMWEQRSIAQEKWRPDFTDATADFDGLVAYDAGSHQAFSGFAQCPVFIHQGGYASGMWPQVERPGLGALPLRFCMVGALGGRKDPFVAIDAFKRVTRSPVWADAAELHLKTYAGGLHPRLEDAIPGLKIHYEVWDHERMVEFYKRMDVLVSVSRGEGKNLPAMEFGSTGGALMLSDVPGHREWWRDEYGWLLPMDDTGRCRQDRLEVAMSEALRAPERVRAAGRAASGTIPVACDWRNVLERLLEQLPGWFGERGRTVFDSAHRPAVPQ